MPSLMQVSNLSKSYGKHLSVNNINFNIEKGHCIALLGPNGAGKTTTLSMLLGLLEPTEGSVKVFGLPPKAIRVREQTGAMLQEVSVMDRLKVREILSLIRSYYPQRMEMEVLLKAAGLTPADLNRYAEKLSGGQKRSLSFALALVGNPELLIFDEPTVGLDTTARRHFWEMVRGFADQGKTILFTTHYLQEAEDNADRILLFSRGVLAADGSPAEIKARLVKKSLSFLPLGDPGLMRGQLLELPAVEACYEKNGRLHVTTEDTDEALRAIFSSVLAVQDVLIDQGKLDEAFEQLTMNPEEAAL